MASEKCVICGHVGLEKTTSDVSRTFNRTTVSATIPMLQCPACEEGYYESADLSAFETAVTDELVRTGNVSGAAFRFVRKSVGITAQDFAALLGVTPGTISRWEQGHDDVDRAAWVVLGSMLHDKRAGRDDTRRTLEAAAHPTPMPTVVKVA